MREMERAGAWSLTTRHAQHVPATSAKGRRGSGLPGRVLRQAPGPASSTSRVPGLSLRLTGEREVRAIIAK